MKADRAPMVDHDVNYFDDQKPVRMPSRSGRFSFLRTATRIAEQNFDSVTSTTSQVEHADNDLFEALGGQAGCKMILDVFFSRVFSDWRLSKFFENVNPHKIKQKQVVIMSYIIKGPEHFKGKDLDSYHKRLIDVMGLKPRHLELFIEHFRTSVEELQVPEEVINICVERMQSVRPLIFGENATF